MELAPWMTCCWPGLPRLWWRGQGSGLFTAAFFAIWLNAALLETFLAPLFANSWGRVANWAILAGFWLVCFRRGAGNLSQIYRGDAHYNDELFSRAQTEYLRGRWFEAESILLRLVYDEPADAESRLLLATLYRHTGRADLAREQLDCIERMPQGDRWRWEILQERTLGEKASPVLATENAEQTAGAPEAAEHTAGAAESISSGPVEQQSSDGAEPDGGGGLSKVA